MEDAIIFNIDVMLAKRKMSVTELAEKVGITMANISILKKQIQNAKEIDVYNYVANKDSKKIAQISLAKIILDDVVISLNNNGEIHTIFIKD